MPNERNLARSSVFDESSFGFWLFSAPAQEAPGEPLKVRLS